MKLTLRQLVPAAEALKEITTSQLPGRTAYILAKFKKAIEPSTSAFDEARLNILMPYAIPDDSEGRVRIPSDKLGEVNEELDKLLDEEVEVDYEPISLEKLVDYWEEHDVSIAVDTLLDADFLFNDL